jgi:hypothetical protein
VADAASNRDALRGITIDSVAVTEADPSTPEDPDLFISRPGCGRRDHVDFIDGK